MTRPSTAELVAWDRKYVWHPFTQMRDWLAEEPLVIERGAGCMVEDVDGNVFLDCAAGIAVNSTGHSHPDIVKAITEQAGKFLHMSGTDFYYEPQVRLAEELAAITPIAGGVRSFFGNSGTEAIEACLKLSRYASGRQNIIAFLGGFHGRSMGALSLTASKAIQRRGFGPMMPGVYHAPFPDCYRCPLRLTYPDCGIACADYVRDVIRYQTAGEIAAIIVEPMQGTAGNVIPPEGFLRAVQQVAKDAGALLIADEMITGFGRTGLMWGSEHDRVVPDIMTVGKGVGGGFPLSAVIPTDDLTSRKPWSNPSASSSLPAASPMW
jgi:4-aminobutyrate aminotransferase